MSNVLARMVRARGFGTFLVSSWLFLLVACGDNHRPEVTGDIDEVDDIEQASVTVGVGLTAELDAMARLHTGVIEERTHEAQWMISDERIAVVDENEVLWGMHPGKTLGRVSYGDDEHWFEITVTTAGLLGLRVEPPMATVPVGSTIELAAIGRYSDGREVDLTAAAMWTTDASNAQVTGGRVEGMTKGASVVRASYGEVAASSEVSVIDMAVTQLVITPSAAQLPLGRSLPLAAHALFANGDTLDVTALVAWQSLSPAIATVDAAGLVTGLALGGADVQATLGGATTSAHVDVTNAVLESLEVSPATIALAAGTSTQLTASGVFSDGVVRDLTAQVAWSTDAPATATVAAGSVLAGAAGTVHITATSGAKSATATVTVTSAHVVAISVTAPSPTIPVATHAQLVATAMLSDGTTQDVTALASWSSDHPLVIGVSSSGEAHALLPGTAVVNATVGTVTGSRALEATAAVLVAIDLAPATLALAKGTSHQVIATGRYSDGSTVDLTASALWTSSASAIASVAGGNVSAHLPGLASITARVGLVTASLDVTVTNATVTAIALSPAAASLPLGMTLALTATATLSDGSSVDVSANAVWSSSAPAIAGVSNTTPGLVDARALGTADITASFGGVSTVAQITVTSAQLLAIQVAPSTLALPRGTTGQLTVTALFSDGTHADVTNEAAFSSSAPAVATVTAGLATAHDVGSATITITAGGKQATAAITVTAATLGALAIDPPAPSLPSGTTLQLTASGTFSDQITRDVTTQVVWTSSNPLVAAVSNAPGARGRVTGLVAGTATITATLDGISASVTVTISAATLVGLHLEPTVLVIAAGLATPVHAIATYSDGSTADVSNAVTWSTLLPAVATVSPAGLVSAHGIGATVIGAQLGAQTAVLAVTVTAGVLVEIQLAPAVLNLAAGVSAQVVATGIFSDGSHADITANVAWSSSAPAVASVAGGLVQAAAPGSATITATFGSISTSLPVTISSATLVSLEVTGGSGLLPLGLTTDLTAYGTYSDGSVLDVTALASWSATGTAVVVSNAVRGRVTGIALGQSTVTATLGAISDDIVIGTSAGVLVDITVSAAPALPVGTSAQLVATGLLSDGSTVDVTTQAVWSSTQSSVASVLAGLVTAHGAGSTTISARVGLIIGTRGITTSAASLLSIDVSPATASLAIGLATSLTATGHYSDGSTQNITASVTWTADVPARATVANAPTPGKVVALAAGPVTITARAGTITGTATVTVTAAVLQAITVASPTATFARDQLAQLAATAHYSDGSSLDVTAQATWASSDAAIAVSNAQGTAGRATAVAIGSATVTATLAGVSGTLPLAVAAGGCHVVINEVKTGGLLLSRDEFVELYNPCAFDIDLSRTRLIHHLLLGIVDISLFELQGTIPANGYRLYGGSSFVGLLDGSILIDLSQVGGGLGLRHIPSGQIVDSMGWGVTLGDLVEGVVALVLPAGSSLARVPNGQDTNNNGADFVVDATPTPRAPN